MRATQTINLDLNGHSVTAIMSARPFRDNYGVQGSPEWIDYDDEKIDSLEIDGVGYDEAGAQIEYGEAFILSIYEAADPAVWDVPDDFDAPDED